MAYNWNSGKNKPTHSTPNILTSVESFAHRKKETTRSDKAVLQHPTSTATTLPALQPRLAPNYRSSFITNSTPSDTACKKLSAEDEAEFAEKLQRYRATLSFAKTYGEHKENQCLIKVHEEKLRIELLERANRRKGQQMRTEAQSLKRKSDTDLYEGHCKTMAIHSAKSDATHSRSGSGNQNRSKQYPPQHLNMRPRPHYQYINKFADIEKLVEKQKLTKDVEPKIFVPLTTTTPWEPKMPTSDELIEFFRKTRKSYSKEG